MNFSFKKVAFAVALALGAQAALAFDGPSTGGSGQNGNLVLTVFDEVKGNSLVQVLQNPAVGDGTINYTEFTPAAVTPNTGLNLTFNVDLSFFTSNGSSLSNLKYTIFAGDAQGVVNASGGQQGVFFTAAQGVPFTGASQITTNLISTMNTQYQNIASTFGAAALSGTGTNFGAGYFGAITGGGAWGETFGNALPVSGAAALNTSLGFYYSTKVSATSSTPAPTIAFANANGLASWNLSSAGLLTYAIAGATSEVPLPAAVWLLLSGIGGLGVVGRRRTVAAAVAA